MTKCDTKSELSSGVMLYGMEALRKLNWVKQLLRDDDRIICANKIQDAIILISESLQEYGEKA